MYEKFQHDTTKNLHFTDIYKLVEPIKNLENGKWLSDIYFIKQTLTKYANLPDDYEIKAYVEHGVQLTDYIGGGFRPDSKPSIVSSPFRVSIIENVSNNGAYAVGPYIAYAKSALSKEKLKSEKVRLGRNLLVFPLHSIRGLKSSYDIGTFCEKINEIAKDFDSVRICLFWKDITMGTAEIYENYGYEVVTAGHYYDPMFMPRLRSIIETSTLTMSNGRGTHIGYCIYLQKPHFLHLMENSKEMIKSDGEDIAKIEFEANKEVQKKLNYSQDIKLMTKLLSKYQDYISDDQYHLLNRYWGFDEVKTPKELRNLLLQLEGEYHLKHDWENKFKVTEQVKKNLRIVLKERETELDKLSLESERIINEITHSNICENQELKNKIKKLKNEKKNLDFELKQTIYEKNQINKLRRELQIQLIEKQEQLKDLENIKNGLENKLNETIQNKNKQIELLKTRIKFLESQLEEKEEELVFIENTASWKITSPFRKMGSWFRKK
jgi:hypothetical protein